MNRFVLQTFHKSIVMLVFNKYFNKNKKSKLCIGDRVAVLNDMFHEYGGSSTLFNVYDPPIEIGLSDRRREMKTNRVLQIIIQIIFFSNQIRIQIDYG
jgi:hypothetical protein